MKRIVAGLLVAAMAVGLAACGSTSDSASTNTEAAVSSEAETDTAETGESTGTSSTDKSDQTYIFVTCLNSLEFMQDHLVGFWEACDELGVTGQAFGPDDDNLEDFTAAFQQAIALNPDGIIVCPTQDMSAMVDEALSAGIPVVYVNIDDAESNRISYIGTGNYALGETGGEYLADLLNGSGTVAELYAAGGGDSVVERISGYEDVLAQYDDIEIVATGDTNADYEQATQAAAAILQANPDLDAFICVDSTGGTGAATAIKEAGLEGQVHVISLDKDAETLAYIQEGVIDATLAQNPELMSYYAVYELYSLTNSTEDMGYTDEMGFYAVPFSIDSGCFIIDADNVSAFITD